jgi:hypothetical protein
MNAHQHFAGSPRKSDFVCIHHDRGNHQPCAADRAMLSPWHQGAKPLRTRPAG